MNIRYPFIVCATALGIAIAVIFRGDKEEIRLPEYYNYNNNYVKAIPLTFPGDEKPTAGLIDYEVDGKHLIELRRLIGYTIAYEYYMRPRLRGKNIDRTCNSSTVNINNVDTAILHCQNTSVSGNNIRTSPYNLLIRMLAKDGVIYEFFEFDQPYQVCIGDEVCYIDSNLDGSLDTKVDGQSIYKVSDGRLIESR